MQRIAFGGPWYGSKVDTRLLVSILGLTTNGPHYGLQPGTLIATDGMLDLARNKMMVDALKSECDWFLSVDADCSFIGQVPALGRVLMHNAMRDNVALVAAPVRAGQRDGWNVIMQEGLGDQGLPPGPCVVDRIGFGFVAFRLGWYRRHWPRFDLHPLPFFQTVIEQDGHGNFKSMSEDHDHCLKVRAQGGLVICDPSIEVKHHVVRAGHPLAAHE